MSFAFSAEISVHDGGTKFYQVIHIQDEKTRRGIVVTHWGAVSPGTNCKPRLHGQFKLELHEAGSRSAANQARRNKEKRGYGAWRTPVNEAGLDQAGLQILCEDWFKLIDADKIFMYLSPAGDSEITGMRANTVIVDEACRTPELKKPEPKVDEPKHEDWGSW